MNKLCRGPQGDVTYHIWKLQFQKRRILKFAFFVHMFKLVTNPQGNIRTLHLPVLEKKNFEDGLLCSYVPTCDPHDWPSFNPWGTIRTNLVEVHREMLYTKYQSSRPSSFKEEEFWNLLSLFLCSNLWPFRTGPVLTPGTSYEQIW